MYCESMAEFMVTRFSCPWLRSEVELTAEREAHIAERHRRSGSDSPECSIGVRPPVLAVVQ
jgi:hypothetical protein